MNIEISSDVYNELLKWAKTWHKTLALTMEETKKESWDKENNKVIILEKNQISKEVKIFDIKLSKYKKKVKNEE